MFEEKIFEKMRFQKVGELRANTAGYFEFNLQNYAKKNTPGVYLWLQRQQVGSMLDVTYVGKAGSGVVARMLQHIGGLKYAETERIERVKSAFGVGDCLEVWFRESEMISIPSLFELAVSSYSVEEEALISRFAPKLNRAKTPAIRRAANEGLQVNDEFNALNFELISANGVQRDLWEDALTSLTESHKREIGEAILSLIHFSAFKGKWPAPDFKVVGSYAAGPLLNQSMIVFGEMAVKKFKKKSQIVFVSLDKELIAFSDEITRSLPNPPDVGDAYSLGYFLSMARRVLEVNY